jgi:hypothetical protein
VAGEYADAGRNIEILLDYIAQEACDEREHSTTMSGYSPSCCWRWQVL